MNEIEAVAMNEIEAVAIIDVSFADYMLTAIVLAMLMAISSIESVLSKAEPAQARAYRLASTTAFIGLFYSVALAGAVETDVLGAFESFTLAVPLFMMGLWLWFHYRASKSIAIDEYVKEFDKRLEDAVLEFVEQETAAGGSVDVYTVYKGCKESATKGMFLRKEYRLLRASRFVGHLDELLEQFGRLTYSPEKVDQALQNLAENKLIQVKEGRYCARRQALPPKSRASTH